MSTGKYDRSVLLSCPTCGGREFAYDEAEPDGMVRCTVCERELTRQEMIKENGPSIEAGIEEMKEEIVADIHKKFKRMFR